MQRRPFLVPWTATATKGEISPKDYGCSCRLFPFRRSPPAGAGAALGIPFTPLMQGPGIPSLGRHMHPSRTRPWWLLPVRARARREQYACSAPDCSGTKALPGTLAGPRSLGSCCLRLPFSHAGPVRGDPSSGTERKTGAAGSPAP